MRQKSPDIILIFLYVFSQGVFVCPDDSNPLDYAKVSIINCLFYIPLMPCYNRVQ